MKTIVGSLAAALLVGLVGACTPVENPDVKRVAAFYIERSNDTTYADSTDSVGLSMSQAELDSLTMDWTADDWLQFWDEVKAAQKP